MTKYRLKKDLPFAKAGAEVRFDNKTFNFEAYSEEFNGQWFPFAPSMQTDLISRGWIEEVKPREFWVLKNHRGLSAHYDKKMAEDCNWEDRTDKSGLVTFSEIIKVREVINE